MTMDNFTAADDDRWKAIVAALHRKDPVLAEAIDKLRQYAADGTELCDVFLNIGDELVTGQNVGHQLG
jgi:hypothetical protein